MIKQAKKSLQKAQNQLTDFKSTDQQQEFKAKELDLQMRFSKFSHEQRSAVANYLNAYNLAAWIYNEILDDDSRIYIDLAMKYTMETQALVNSMHDISDNPQEVDNLVNQINNGE